MARIKLLEDISPTEVDAQDIELTAAIASHMGNCEVVDNVIYYLEDDFEIWNDDDTDFTPIDHGIFMIIQVNTDNIKVYNTKESTCADVDNIGIEPMDYFVYDEFGEYKTLRDFVNSINDYFGRDWFGEPGEVDEFIDEFEGALHEDLAPAPVSYRGGTIEDAYEDFGSELFEPHNLQMLKDSGLIGDDGYPIQRYEAWDGSMREDSYSLEQLYELDYSFIESEYIRDLVKKEIKDYFSERKRRAGGVAFVRFDDDDINYEGYRDLSEDFVKQCFRGEAYEAFWNWGWDISFSDCNYYMDDIPESVRDDLEQHGFPRDIFEQMLSGDADEETALAKYYDDLEIAFTRAVETGWMNGSADECQKDFDNALEDSIPSGCVYERLDYNEIEITVPDSFIEEHIADLWELLSENSGMVDCLDSYIRGWINEGLSDSFREPYNGWQDFSKDAFKEDLIETVGEVLYQVEKDSEPEVSLLEPEEQPESDEKHEDLDLQRNRYPTDKPRKMFYAYKDYNPELSLKAWVLDELRLRMLMDWAEKNDKELYSELDRVVDFDVSVTGEYENSIIMSTIKPSYADSYDGLGYTIWEDTGLMYDTKYLGAIPVPVGKAILNGTPIREEIKVIQVPMEYDKRKLATENIEEDIIR